MENSSSALDFPPKVTEIMIEKLRLEDRLMFFNSRPDFAEF